MANLVTATVTYGNRTANHGEPDDWQRSANPWTVELRYKRRKMTVEFWTGSALTKEPTAADVIECLLSDASSADESFEGWCATYGYDTDSRKAERTYNAIVKQTAKLKRLLGEDYGAFLCPDVDFYPCGALRAENGPGPSVYFSRRNTAKLARSLDRRKAPAKEG